MRAVEIIVKKRDGAELTAAEIEFFIGGFTDGSIPDYQATAWAMAIYFQGMTDAEATALTLAMLRSGQQLDPHVYFPPGALVVDKHSTGGVGDKTSLALAPLVASLGLPVGKLSGRGLGYSGGTIDKLESIDGFTVQLSNEAFVRQLHDVGLVIGSQTADLAPADGKLYALRDVSGTVPVLPLIASSIMSKKLASGADAIVLDVKVGHGAFMKTQADARRLARLMVEIGRNAGRRMSAVISAMDEPLGRAVGNALELKEAIATLHGNGPADFEQLVVTLAVQMLSLGGLGTDELLLQNQARNSSGTDRRGASSASLLPPRAATYDRSTILSCCRPHALSSPSGRPRRVGLPRSERMSWAWPPWSLAAAGKRKAIRSTMPWGLSSRPR